MNLKSIGIGIIATAVTTLGLSTPCHTQQEMATRTIAHRPSVPLRAQLGPKDKTVIVTRTVSGIRPVSEPTFAQEVSYAAGMSDLVLIGDLVSAEPVLVEDGSWIGTRLKFRTVQAVLPAGVKAANEVQVVWTGGGELIIDNVTVRAGLLWRPSASRRYLLFLGRNTDTGACFMSRTPLVVESDRVVNPWERDQAVASKDVLHSHSLRAVLDSLLGR